MLRLAELRRRAVDDRTRVDQVDRIELVSAVVALVAARFREPADRTRALDVSIRKGVSSRRGERSHGRLLDQPAVLVERAEQVLGHARVVARGGAREAVVRDPEITQILARRSAVAIGNLTRRDALPVGSDHRRRAVLVRPAHHQDVVALQAVVAREDVRGHREAHHVPEVTGPARIRPRGGDQNLPAVRQRSTPARTT